MLKKLLRVFSNDVIEFYCHPTWYNVIPEPKPAIKYLPDWFKKLPTKLENEKDLRFNTPTMTAKKCLPMLDAMSFGYVIPLCGDLQVTLDKDTSFIKVHNPPEINIVDSHSIGQVGGRNAPRFPLHPIKFMNYWVIKTAPGWSTLFIPPINHIDAPFTCFSGLVDTDNYPREINFPAVWNDTEFDGVLPAGTPLVTAIPIKRNSLKKKPKVREMTQSEYDLSEVIRKRQQTRSRVYTQELRSKK